MIGDEMGLSTRMVSWLGGRMGRTTSHRHMLRACVVGIFLILAVHAQASGLGYSIFQDFKLFNTNADGTIMVASDGSGILLTGGNNGTGEPGTTDVVMIAPENGTVMVHYWFSTLDIDPGTGEYFDEAGYLIGGLYTVFDPLFSSMPASLSLDVLAGQSFGFRVTTFDNTGEPGVLTVSQLPGSATGAPEPTFAVPIGLLAIGWISWTRRRAFLRLGSRLLPGIVLAGFGMTASSDLQAQSQFYYAPSDATGRLALTATTNASRSSTSPLFLKSLSRTSAPEFQVNVVRPNRQRPKSLLARSSAMVAGAIPSLKVSYTGPAQSFLGLTHLDQRNANNGNQFSVEPPSPMIAVGEGYILEGVNNAIEVYSTSGSPMLPVVLSTNELFGLGPAIDRTTGIYGPYPTDMRVFYDRDIRRWFVLQRAQDYDPWYGIPLNSSHLYLAVSQTSDPTASYNVYTMDTTNTGRPGCPCFADYPQIGADQYGIYISSDLYDPYYGYFQGASILAVSKAGLAAGAAAPAAQEFAIPPGLGYERSIAPAVTPPGASYFLASGGVEYFVSSNWQVAMDNRFGLWALTNTASLAGTPALSLIESIITVAPYTYPPVANQKPGTLLYGYTLSYIDGGFDCRILSATYAGGRLFVTYATGAVDNGGRSVVAGGFAILSPTYRAGRVAALLLRQGNLIVDGNHVLRPAVSVTPQGRGAVVFTLAGPDYYPSAALVPINVVTTGDTAYVAGIGAGPEDGFTGYGPDLTARWGDYSSAVAAADGSIWMTTEYIPDAPRALPANWGTRVIRYVP